MARLGDICKVCASSSRIDDETCWLLNLDMVEQQTGAILAYQVVHKDNLKGSIVQFSVEHVLYSKLRPNLNKVVLPDRAGYATSEMLPLLPDKKLVTREYLAYFLRSNGFVQWAVSKTAGAKMPRLGTKELLKKEIPLPSLDEQKKIATKFRTLEKLIAKRKQQLEKLDELLKARFVEMFGDVERNPYGIPTADMTSVCEIIDGDRGVNYPKQDEFSDCGYCLFLNAKNVTAEGFVFEHCLFISKEKDIALRKGKLQRGDVVLTTRGTIGNLAYYSSSVPFDNVRINSGMVILRMRHDVVSEIFFIEQFKLKLQSIKDKIASGSAQPQLPISTMKNIKLLIPTIKEQNQFAAFVEQIEKTKSTVQKSLDELRTLFDSLMQEYFG